MMAFECLYDVRRWGDAAWSKLDDEKEPGSCEDSVALLEQTTLPYPTPVAT
jgi:hypothetical protein